MSARTLTMTEPLYDYLLTINRPLPDLFARLRAETLQLPNGGMQISVEQGHFMDLLTRLIGAKKVLEVGVFTGYSALTVASALPEDGKLIAIDNTLWYGKVADETVQDESTVALRNLNAKLCADPRVTLSVLPVGDGLSLALKRP